MRFILISPILIPYMIIIFFLAFLADELVRGKSLGNWVEWQLYSKKSLLNKMATFINLY